MIKKKYHNKFELRPRVRHITRRARWSKMWKLTLLNWKGLTFMCVVYLHYYYKVVKIFSDLSNSVLSKFFKLDNLLFFFSFLQKNSRFMFLFNFLKIFDKFFITFFNFYALFKKLDSYIDVIKYRKKKFPFFFGFFLPSSSFFIFLEVFNKSFHMNWFNYDFFYYNEYDLTIYKYVMPYNKFCLRLDIVTFFFLFKELESTRMVKYNEYIFNSFLFFEFINFRFLYVKRYFHILEDLYVAQVQSFRLALHDHKFLVFKPRFFVKDKSIVLRKHLLDFFINSNFVFQFFFNVINLRYLSKIFLFVFEGYLTLYYLIDIYKAFMSRLKLVEKFRWRFFHFADVPRNVYSWHTDILFIYFSLKERMDLNLSCIMLRGWGLEKFYFCTDLILNKLAYKYFFFSELLSMIFCDFNDYIIISTIGTVEINHSFFFSMYRHFDVYLNTLIFNFFDLNIFDYLNWFFGFEYFYWRILNTDFSYKLGLYHFWNNPNYDFLNFNRYLGNAYLMQRYAYTRKKGSVFTFYYLFLFYRDIIFKSVYSSFEINLLFYFMFGKFYFYDNSRFQYLMLLNGDLKFVSKFFNETSCDVLDSFRNSI